MFKVIPSLSVSKGQVVRVKQGDFSKMMKYKWTPIDIAKLFEENGCEVMHFIDLDGALKEEPVNYHVLESIVEYTNLKIDFAGGIRTDGDINKVFEYGATFFTSGTIAVTKPELFQSWLISYGREAISLAADTIDGVVTYKGWSKKTSISILDHIEKFYKAGLKYLELTDVSRDGLLEGPNFELIDEVVKKFPNLDVAAIGGVRSVDDIKKLRDMGVYAVIIGRAIYEDKVKVEDLQQFAQR